MYIVLPDKEQDVEITIPANYKTDREKDHEERIAEN